MGALVRSGSFWSSQKWVSWIKITFLTREKKVKKTALDRLPNKGDGFIPNLAAVLLIYIRNLTHVYSFNLNLLFYHEYEKISWLNPPLL
jgi:hypothetical protein